MIQFPSAFPWPKVDINLGPVKIHFRQVSLYHKAENAHSALCFGRVFGPETENYLAAALVKVILNKSIKSKVMEDCIDFSFCNPPPKHYPFHSLRVFKCARVGNYYVVEQRITTNSAVF